MKTIEDLLVLMDDLNRMGLDNSCVVVIPQDSEGVSLKNYFGINGNDGNKPLKRGVYVYNMDDSTVKDRATCDYIADGGTISFFSI